MVFNSGTGVLTHIAMMDKVIEVVTSRNLTAVAVNAGGTGHAVGDIIDITATGSTSTEVAKLEVTSVSAGVIDGIRVYRGGAYTVDPTTTTGNAQSATTGSGTGATFNLTFSAATWALNRRTQEALSATVAAGGTGYSVSDQLTVTLGDGVQGDGGVDAVFNVDSVGGGGAVTGVSLVTAGNYEEAPTNAASTSGGGGSGCTLTVTYQDATTQNSIAMLQGEGSGGTDEIHVGIKTFEQANGFDTAYNWAMYGMTGYSATIEFHNQPGIDNNQIDSDGSLPATDQNAIMVLKPNDADPDISWWIHHTGRRIVVVCKVEGPSSTIYSSCYMGFLNQIATETEYPYPLAIIGGTNDQNRIWTNTSDLTGGIVESIFFGSGDPTGPGFVRIPDGTWLGFCAELSATPAQRFTETEFGIYPFIDRQNVTGNDQTVADGSDVDWTGGTNDIIPSTGVPGTPGQRLKPTPGSGDSQYWLVEPIVCRFETFPLTYNFFGSLDGVYWFSEGGEGVVSEDRFVNADGTRYLVFQNGNRTQEWSYFCIDED